MPTAKNSRLLVFKEFAICVVVSLILTATSLNLYSYINRKPDVLGVETSPMVEIDYWKTLTIANPTYRDAWIELAKLEVEIGERELANSSLEIAKAIDPNSIKILMVEREILR